jgi:hypothetical protein
LRDELERLENSYVLVGYPAGTITHAQSKQQRRKKAGESMAQIAAYNEFGTKNIPARPFIFSTVAEKRQDINRVIEKQYIAILDGKRTVKQGLEIIGLYVKKEIDLKIGSLRYPPNSPRTIKIKGSDKPLIDFAQMRQALQYKVVIK